MGKLLSIEEALVLSRSEVREEYRDHVNPGLATLLSLMDFDKRFVKASGCRVWDAEGNEYLDFLGGYGAVNLGHNHPKVVEALEKIKGVPTLIQASLSPLAAALAHNLAQITPGSLSRSFFCNSGAEAVEGALKLARAATGRQKLVSCKNSFHGKSLGALSVTGRDKYQAPFRPLLPNCEQISFGDIEQLEAQLAGNDVAAFIVEPIQGEGGIIPAPPGYLKAAKELCEKHGTLLILDEIQTGLGRTGKMFACEHDGVVPDIMCIAKSLGGGIMPIGAFITTPDIWDRAYGGLDKCLLHTSTFGGNAWAAAAGIATINVLVQEDLPAQAEAKGRRFLEQLKSLASNYPVIKEVRGLGLMIGLEFDKPAKGIMDVLTAGMVNKYAQEYLASFVAGELLNRYRIITAYTLNNPNVIRLEPPLVVTDEQIDTALNCLESLLKSHKGFTGLFLSGIKSVAASMLKKQ